MDIYGRISKRRGSPTFPALSHSCLLTSPALPPLRFSTEWPRLVLHTEAFFPVWALPLTPAPALRWLNPSDGFFYYTSFSQHSSAPHTGRAAMLTEPAELMHRSHTLTQSSSTQKGVSVSQSTEVPWLVTCMRLNHCLHGLLPWVTSW